MITESFWVCSGSMTTLESGYRTPEISCFVGYHKTFVCSGSVTLLTCRSTRLSSFLSGEDYHETFGKSSMLKEADMLIV